MSILSFRLDLSDHYCFFLGCVVVLTGATDYISDGNTVVVLENGHPLLGQITGSGCILGSIIASYCAAAAQLESSDNGGIFRGDMFTSAIAGYVFLFLLSSLLMNSEFSVYLY